MSAHRSRLRILLVFALVLAASFAATLQPSGDALGYILPTTIAEPPEFKIIPLNNTDFYETKGNTEDKSLFVKANHHEKPITDEQVAARFDFFRTQPSFRAPRVSIKFMVDDRSKLEPGYYFYAPFQCGVVGPQIFDQDGLVYWGVNEFGGGLTKNFEPCTGTEGEANHLCWNELFLDEYDHEYTRQRVFANDYTQVGTDYGPVGGTIYPNSHEFNMLPDGKSFMQIVYNITPFNLAPYGHPYDGYIQDGCFQEINTTSKDVIFHWCASDHISLDETYFYLNIRGQQNFTEGIAGLGTFLRGWDFMHMNSVDKLPDGDYLASSRHFNSVLKIAGKCNTDHPPGTVIWRLNGKRNNFHLASNFTFLRQHHARYVSSAGRTTIISLFNNDFVTRNITNLEGHSSGGQVIALDEENMTATLLQEYKHPYRGRGWRESVTIAGGSTDVLPVTGNVFVGWNTKHDVSEFARDGELLFHAEIGNHTCRSYRSTKKPWVGKPRWPPSLLAYSQRCGASGWTGKSSNAQAPLVAYVSWNGATEVAAWRFYVSSTSSKGPWFSVGLFVKSGFETRAQLKDSFAPHVLVEALDLHGRVLGSSVMTTFVPLPQLDCNEDGCAGRNFTYSLQFSAAENCPLGVLSAAPVVAIVLALLCGVEVMILVLHVLSAHWWSFHSSEATWFFDRCFQWFLRTDYGSGSAEEARPFAQNSPQKDPNEGSDGYV